jgi:hypothetical protein
LRNAKGEGDLAAISLHTSTSKERSTIMFSSFPSLPPLFFAYAIYVLIMVSPFFLSYLFFNLNNVFINPSEVFFCFETPVRYTLFLTLWNISVGRL